ncbi:hypothetical protein PUN4_990026 [Paraburkholderia unamae]|nr:hypothetical protein PUN4_990026 [Paraburkholderia unamae]
MDPPLIHRCIQPFSVLSSRHSPLQFQQRPVENRALDRNGLDSYIGLAATYFSAAKEDEGRAETRGS